MLGIFDSGLGGLTAVNALQKALPAESFIYVGDTARLPYGGRDKETLLSFGREILKFLQGRNVKAVIVACGTISSNVMDELRREFAGLPLIDVASALRLEPGRRRVGVIATEATANSGFFQAKLPGAEVIACPLFVPNIEADTITEAIVADSLARWLDSPPDVLVLGCTHYPLIAPIISRLMADTVLIDMAEAAVRETGVFLRENNLLATATGEVFHEFYVSGDTEKFGSMASRITGTKVTAHKINWN